VKLPPIFYSGRMSFLACSTPATVLRGLAVGLVAAAILPVHAAAQAKKHTAPEVFNARASVAAAAGRGDAYVTMRVDRYSAPKDIDAMEQALKNGGTVAFGVALRKAPIVGHFEVGTQTFAIRWARQSENDRGRVITLVTDTPVYFVGAGVPGAKSREGFDLSVIQLNVDTAGMGEGTMAAAAKVKPNADGGVAVDAYEGEPIKLLSIIRKIS
jgi:hypothetical protein